MANVCVVIPWGGHDPDRTKALWKVTYFYGREFPDWPLRIIPDHGHPFSRARACNKGVERAPAPLVILNDADSICEPDAIRAAVALANEEDALVQAFTRYVRLDAEGIMTWAQEPTSNHGCVAVRRSVFLAAGGYDEAYEGWGYEDLDLNLRLSLLRVPGTLTHLHHEPANVNPANHERFVAKRG